MEYKMKSVHFHCTLGVPLETRGTWKSRIKAKNQTPVLVTNHKLQINFKEQTSDLTIYKTILKPVWAYGLQLWRTSIARILKYCKCGSQKRGDRLSMHRDT